MKAGNHWPFSMIYECSKTEPNHIPNKHDLYTRETKFLEINWDETLEVPKNDTKLSLQNFLTKLIILLGISVTSELLFTYVFICLIYRIALVI